ncbi:MAG: hypothetical protein KKH72_10755 [Alphaproteobacteria bacterium]|nr:hypothetical protein [Alphaproteobacteria bacterium]
MKSLLKTGLALLWTVPILFAAALGVTPAQAGEQPNVMLMIEDADTDSVPRDSRPADQVLYALATEMQNMGFRTYDETAVTMGITDPTRVRRTDAELFTIAKRVPNVPIDVIVVFQIYAAAQQNPYAAIIDLQIRITGRLLHVQSGRSLGNWEVAYGPGELPPLPPNCNRDCVLEHVGGEARRIASDVGQALAVKLDALSPTAPQPMMDTNMPMTTVSPGPIVSAPMSECTGLTSAYTLEFRGFDLEEITRIEEYLVVFKGYDHHRPVRVMATSAEYWYETCSDVARLDRNLRLMTEQLGVQAQISMVGNRFLVAKIGTIPNRN